MYNDNAMFFTFHNPPPGGSSAPDTINNKGAERSTLRFYSLTAYSYK